MLVQFGNNWIQKIPLTAKLDEAYGLVQFCLSSEFFSSNYFQIGQHVVLLHIQTLCLLDLLSSRHSYQFCVWFSRAQLPTENARVFFPSHSLKKKRLFLTFSCFSYLFNDSTRRFCTFFSASHVKNFVYWIC